MKFSSMLGGALHSHSASCLYPAIGVVCPGCGARVGKPCVSTVPTLGVGAVGVPIDGVHTERVAVARENGVA